jgi:hypothetical protein
LIIGGHEEWYSPGTPVLSQVPISEANVFQYARFQRVEKQAEK